MNPPYERIIQWSAGPVSTASGLLAKVIAGNGPSHSPVASAIYQIGIFGVTTLVTYAAHHKWLSNLPKWWVTPKPTATDTLRAQLVAMGATPEK